MQRRDLTCQPRPPTSSRCSRVRTRERATARSLSGGGAARALAACACLAVLIGVGPCLMEARCASETALSFGAQPSSDVSAAASNTQPAFECAHRRTCHRAISLGMWRSTRACGARAPRRAGWSWCMSYGSPLRQRDDPLPWYTAALRRASSGLQRAAGVRTDERATARSLLGGGAAARACGVRAPRRWAWSRSMPYRSPLR